MSNQLADEVLKRFHDRLQNDYRFFAKHSLKIKSEAGPIIPFLFNPAQEFLHKQIEQQLQAMGKVRAIVIKGRQEGCSTYIEGRYYWKSTRNEGQSVFILSHEADTTEKLFQMVERFHANCPEPVKAKTDVENRRRIIFSGLQSEYFVGTAGNENVGRGGTVQLLHASEAAFYPNAVGFSTGLLQSVPDLAGTEVIIESTTNGMDPLLYPMTMDALQGKNEYQVIFIPWYWMNKYRKQPPPDFVMDKEEFKLAEQYHLDPDQIFWRRMKIGAFPGSVEEKLRQFMQEYPMSLVEAFVSTGSSLIPSPSVAKARKTEVKDPRAALVMGCDPNEHSGEWSVAFRRGRVMGAHHEYSGRKPMECVAIIASLIDANNPDKCFLDCSQGWSVHDRLVELGYGDVVVGIMFGDGAIEERVYLNRRAEMWVLMALWFINGGVCCPDEDFLHKQFTCVPASKKTSSGLTKLESKEKIIEDTKIDPHTGDAYALTFAMPVRRRDLPNARMRGKKGEGKTILKTSRFRKSLDGDQQAASANMNWGH